MVNTFIGPIFRGFADDELADPNQIKERNKFDISITEKFGASAKLEKLSANEPDVKTPYLALYEENDGMETSPVPVRKMITMIDTSMMMYFSLHLVLIRLIKSNVENMTHMAESLENGMLKLL